jgi:hypothetical protein
MFGYYEVLCDFHIYACITQMITVSQAGKNMYQFPSVDIYMVNTS